MRESTLTVASESARFADMPPELRSPRSQKDPDRVRRATPAVINRAIDRETDRNITRYAAMSDQRIRERVRELDQEWDIERVLELNAATLGLTGLAMALNVDRRWLVLPGVALAFLLQHAVQGWCPPLPILRRLGIRTRGEIDREKFTLLSLLETGGEAL